ncbi:hypothetical protein ACFXG4_41180 [Nocardia sp. NPDC059246]|uniref:hypothetical protein n=1 Tax=unclassified Nocardia TaxID=2637762 RepID=UPI0036B44DB5
MDSDRALSPRTSRQSPELVARLERSRQRSQQRRASAKAKEKTLTGAETDFITAWNAIEVTVQRRDKEVAALQQQIDDARTRAAVEIDSLERDQAAAATVVRAHVGTDAEVADLLEIPIKRARELLAVFRKGDNSPAKDEDPMSPQHKAFDPAEATTTAVEQSPATLTRLKPEPRQQPRTVGVGSDPEPAATQGPPIPEPRPHPLAEMLNSKDQPTEEHSPD